MIKIGCISGWATGSTAEDETAGTTTAEPLRAGRILDWLSEPTLDSTFG